MGAARRTRRHDRDMVPDFADGYNLDGEADNDDDSLAAQTPFVPLVLEIPEYVDEDSAKIKFDYTESEPSLSPSGVTITTDPETGIDLYTPAAGSMRIWTEDAGTQRDAAPIDQEGDYVAPDEPYSLDDLGLSPGGSVTLYIEGIDPGQTTITALLDLDGDGSGYVDDHVEVTVVKLDIDVDSDNDATLSQSDLEDAIEERDGDGVGQVGKRIFVNVDDDNKNGKLDVHDSNPDYDRHDLHDKDFAEIKLEALAVSGLQGYSLWLGVDGGMKLWGDDQKTPLSELPHPPAGGINRPDDLGYDPGCDTWYYWSIDSEGASFPATLFVEGYLLRDAKVYWRLVEPGGSGTNNGDVVERDTVEVKSEFPVWPNQDPSADWDPGENTSKWNGFRLSPGWYIEKSLGEIINDSTGYIRTEYPQETAPGQWEGTEAQKSDAKLDLAELCGTETWEDNVTVRIEVTYEFEQSPNITVGKFVDTNLENRWQASFFHNSGVKIENRAEIQIFDTASLLDAINGVEADDRNHAIIDGNEVSLIGDVSGINTQGYVKLHYGDPPVYSTVKDPADYAKCLISGIPYNWDDKLETETWMDRLDRAPKGGQKMIIEVSRGEDGKYDFSVQIGEGASVDFHEVPAAGTADPGMLYLQSHWGSGVTFTSAKVKKL